MSAAMERMLLRSTTRGLRATFPAAFAFLGLSGSKRGCPNSHWLPRSKGLSHGCEGREVSQPPPQSFWKHLPFEEWGTPCPQGMRPAAFRGMVTVGLDELLGEGHTVPRLSLKCWPHEAGWRHSFPKALQGKEELLVFHKRRKLSFPNSYLPSKVKFVLSTGVQIFR